MSFGYWLNPNNFKCALYTANYTNNPIGKLHATSTTVFIFFYCIIRTFIIWKTLNNKTNKNRSNKRVGANCSTETETTVYIVVFQFKVTNLRVTTDTRLMAFFWLSSLRTLIINAHCFAVVGSSGYRLAAVLI